MSVDLLRRWLDGAMDVLAPDTCAACDTPDCDVLFCPSCARDVSAPEQRLGAADLFVFAAARYQGAVAEAVKRLKYSDRPDLARRLGRWMAGRTRAAYAHAGVWLVPVPLHPRRLASRGFNQSALLARQVSRCWRVGVDPTALRRIRDTPQQAVLGREERFDNVRYAFEARGRLEGRSVILLDDVVTTGATALGCAEALRLAGANVVAVMALADAGAFGPTPY